MSQVKRKTDRPALDSAAVEAVTESLAAYLFEVMDTLEPDPDGPEMFEGLSEGDKEYYRTIAEKITQWGVYPVESSSCLPPR